MVLMVYYSFIPYKNTGWLQMIFTLLIFIKKSKLCTVMKFVGHKQELWKFCHLPDFNVSPSGDSTCVKIIIFILPYKYINITKHNWHSNFCTYTILLKKYAGNRQQLY